MLREHETSIRVRYEDADPGGFVHHSKYFVFFEIGRTELLRASGEDYRRMESEGIFAVVVKASCQYHKPARFDDVLTIQTKVVRTTRARIEHAYLARRGSETIATGNVTLTLVDRDGKVRRVPKEWLNP